MNTQNTNNMIELLKDTIEQLYTNEGKSLIYISQLLKINRKKMSYYIKQVWKLDPPKTAKLKPSQFKQLNKQKEYIRSCLERDVPIYEIVKNVNISKQGLVDGYILQDKTLKNIYYDYIDRNQSLMFNNIQILSEKDFPQEEQWKNILGYPQYEVSSNGRIRKILNNEKYQLLNQVINSKNGRLYVSFQSKTLNVARLVGFAFVDGYSEYNNTINHKDGNILNNNVSNLEWVSQQENNQYSYDVLHRQPSDKRRFDFKVIQYQEKYEFKTVAALAKFLSKSETQVRRYLEDPEKYHIKLIK